VSSYISLSLTVQHKTLECHLRPIHPANLECWLVIVVGNVACTIGKTIKLPRDSLICKQHAQLRYFSYLEPKCGKANGRRWLQCNIAAGEAPEWLHVLSAVRAISRADHRSLRTRLDSHSVDTGYWRREEYLRIYASKYSELV
jgi:hypothetical protein